MTAAAIVVGAVWAGVIVSAIVLAIWAAIDGITGRRHHHHCAAHLDFAVGPVAEKS